MNKSKIIEVIAITDLKWAVKFANGTTLELTAIPDQYYNDNGCIVFKWADFVWRDFVEAINVTAKGE